MNALRIILILLSISCISACSSSDAENLEEYTYEGPMSETRSVEILYSDSGYVRVKVMAPLRHDFMNGDWSFPDGLHMIFYDKLADTTTTLVSNQGYYDKENNIFTATGDVVFKSVKDDGDQLSSEELIWLPKEHKFYSNKPTEVLSGGDLLTGSDFEAAEDFSWFEIRNNTGEFNSVF